MPAADATMDVYRPSNCILLGLQVCQCLSNLYMFTKLSCV